MYDLTDMSDKYQAPSLQHINSKKMHLWGMEGLPITFRVCYLLLCVLTCSAYPWLLLFASVSIRSSYLWERKRAAGAVRWPAPAGSAKHWGWTGSSTRCSSQVPVSLVGAGGRRGGTPVHTQHSRFERYTYKTDIHKSVICLCTAQQGKNGNLL